jgi:23S rRNA pseudouridine955/2504/2580 synthase
MLVEPEPGSRPGELRFEVGEDDAERRLDAFVRRRVGLPRSLVMKLARRGEIRVNGARAEAGRKLAAGDVVVVRGAREGPAGKAPELPSPPPGGRAAPRGIVHEDADILVFDKPSGLVSHPGSGHGRGVVDILLAYLGVAAGPALVNRLDRDTSGLLVLAKTPLALRRLNATIRRGGLEKGYTALARGVPRPAEGEIRAALRKERQADGLERMAVVPAGAEGALAAVTRYRTLRVLDGGRAALLALAPETGRTHQLRAHLASRGHPIAGDPKYGDAAWNRDLEERAGLRRLFLHAGSLAFPHPRNAEPVRFEAPLPAELVGVLERLGEPPSREGRP